MTGVRNLLFIDRGGIIWDWEGIIWDQGANFSKYIDRGSHRGASQRGTWTG